LDYRGVFLCKNSSVFRAEEFIFMVNFEFSNFDKIGIMVVSPTLVVSSFTAKEMSLQLLKLFKKTLNLSHYWLNMKEKLK
jgi:hypothetical protein